MTDWAIPDSSLHPAANRPYFLLVMAVALALTAVLFLAGFAAPAFQKKYSGKAPFYTGILLFLCVLNILTAKTATLPVLYFPSLDRVFGVLVEDAAFLGKCLLYSLRLQVTGWVSGAVAGVLTGVAIGFSKGARYWIYPLVRVLGPIPSTAWIPLAMISFPTVVSASAFLIALAVWFPTSVLTASGISSIPNAYGVSKQFTNPQGEVITALSNVDLDIAPGSFISLIGPSGCGKSTLLRLIAGLIQPDSGTLTLDGAPITKPGSDRGFMFQDHTLFPWLTIYDNIAFGLRAQGVFQEKEASVKEFIDLVGLTGFEKYYPHQLSGGMCQRASLARALVGHPKVLLLDEPLGALDAFTRMNIQDEILRIWKEHSMTMIMVTHDVDEAVYLSSRVVVMTPRPGRITKIVPVELAQPRARSSQDFLHYRAEILRLLHYGGTIQEPDYYL